jgi:hypothetical protein
MGPTTRKPCADCRQVGASVGSLSRNMFSIDGEGVLTLRSSSNAKLLRLNGKCILFRKQEQLCDGDILTVGRFKAIPLMTFHMRRKRVVTPEINRRAEKQPLPMKKSIKRRRDEIYHVGGDEPAILRAGLNHQSPHSMPGVRKNLSRPPPQKETSKVNAYSWLRKTTGRRKPLFATRRKAPSAPKKSSARKSQDDLFSSSSEEDSDDLLRITPQRRLTPKPVDKQEKVAERPEVFKKPKRFVINYSPGKRSKQWKAAEQSLTPEEDDANTTPSRQSATVIEEGDQIDDDELSGALARMRPKSAHDGESFSAPKNRPNTPVEDDRKCAPEPNNDSWLSLPRCPTYDSDDTHIWVDDGQEELPACEHLPEPENQNVWAKPEDDDNLSEPENESAHFGKRATEVEVVEGTEERDQPQFATDLTHGAWSTMTYSQSAGGPTSVRHALANLIVAHRVRLQDEAWLPDMVQNSFVDINGSR